MNHLFAEAMPSIDWFEAGEVVYLTRDRERPPVSDIGCGHPHDRRTLVGRIRIGLDHGERRPPDPTSPRRPPEPATRSAATAPRALPLSRHAATR